MVEQVPVAAEQEPEAPYELLLARNPGPESGLAYLLRLPLGGRTVLRTSGTWPRTKALCCHPMPATESPEDAEIVERIGLISCVRRGAAIDLIADRGRENRSQLVFTMAKGREVVFWQTPRTRKQARPNVTTPTARASGIAELEIIVDTREQYAYRFAGKQVRSLRRALPSGDYGVIADGHLVAAVERKSLHDLVASLTGGKLRYAIGELAALPRGAVVVEDRYSQVFKSRIVRPALIADGLAECLVRWPEVAIVFCENRKLAEEWTYRYLAAAHLWATTEPDAIKRIGAARHELGPAPRSRGGPPGPGPSDSELRDWARANDLVVAGRGRVPTKVREAWDRASTTASAPRGGA
ncbi:MAG: ERCC4 domain-containing protein [Acidimicrobiales bacterium]